MYQSITTSFLMLLFSCFLCSFQNNAQAQNRELGILGLQAPEWEIDSWIDANGEATQIELSDYQGKVVFLVGFQSWCPGCHSRAFPLLQQLVKNYADNDKVAFLAVQTVFEGHRVNTPKKLKATQKKYDLAIPFGHDPGDRSTRNRSKILTNYRTGGTPWVVVIDSEGTVMYNDFHIEAVKAKRMIDALILMSER